GSATRAAQALWSSAGRPTEAPLTSQGNLSTRGQGHAGTFVALMRSRIRAIWLILLTCSLLLAACGSGGPATSSSSSTASSSSSSSSTAPPGSTTPTGTTSGQPS